MVNKLRESHRAFINHNFGVGSPTLRNAFNVETRICVVAVFVNFDGEGVKELHGSEGEVNLTITEFLVVSFTLSVEIDLGSDSSGNAGGSCGNSGDDISGDHLSLVAVSLIDLVVSST